MFMAKSAKKKAAKIDKKPCWCGMRLFFLLLLSALGFATFIQGILLQVYGYGLFYGFLTYVLAFVFFGAAKVMKFKLMACSCEKKI
jgi:hypothetical protein